MALSLRNCGALLAVSLTPLGLVSYVVFLGVTFQDPIRVLDGAIAVGRDNRGPIRGRSECDQRFPNR